MRSSDEIAVADEIHPTAKFRAKWSIWSERVPQVTYLIEPFLFSLDVR